MKLEIRFVTHASPVYRCVPQQFFFTFCQGLAETLCFRFHPISVLGCECSAVTDDIFPSTFAGGKFLCRA